MLALLCGQIILIIDYKVKKRGLREGIDVYNLMTSACYSIYAAAAAAGKQHPYSEAAVALYAR